MVPGTPLKGPPRPRARRLLPLPLLLLAVMAGKSRADMGCFHDGNGDYLLTDPSKCWAAEINAAYNGKMDDCYSRYGNAVSRLRARKCAVRSVLFVVCATQVFLFASPLLLQFPEMKDEIVVTVRCCGQNELCPQLHSSTPCGVERGPGARIQALPLGRVHFARSGFNSKHTLALKREPTNSLSLLPMCPPSCTASPLRPSPSTSVHRLFQTCQHLLVGNISARLTFSRMVFQ